MPKQDPLEKIQSVLFLSEDEASQKLTDPRDMQRRQRYMICVSKLLEEPLTPDSDLVKFLISGCNGVIEPVSQSQAYRDLVAIQKITGNIKLASKNWYRWMIVEGSKKAYNLAMTMKDAKGAAASLDKLGKYTRADKDDVEFDFSHMLPPLFEPTDDVSVAGIEKTPDLEERRKSLRAMFKQEMKDKASDATLV